jgi:hypothetical protein
VLLRRVKLGASGIQGVQNRLKGILDILRGLTLPAEDSERFVLVESHRYSSSTRLPVVSVRVIPVIC